jgi:hypothetical protein
MRMLAGIRRRFDWAKEQVETRRRAAKNLRIEQG